MFKLPSFPLINICSIVSKIKANYFLTEASAINQVKKAKVPILFIHGDKDSFVPYPMVDELYEACNSPKEKLIIKEAKHAKSEKVDTNLYWKTVINFVNKYIK